MDCNHRPNAKHQALIQRRVRLLECAARSILELAPETTSIWCYGINALQPERPCNDWDFMAFVEDSTNAARLNQLNDLEGPLSKLRKIDTQSLDVQAMHYSDTSECAHVVRSEGFCIWHKLIAANQHAA